MPAYTAYGLGIESCIPLPELTLGAKSIDLTIKLDRILDPPSKIDNAQFYYWRNEQEIGLHWQELGTFLI